MLTGSTGEDSASSPKPSNAPGRVITLASVLGIVSIAIFIITELVAVAAALVWSISGLLHLPSVLTWLIAATVALPTAWACWQIVLRICIAETDPANN